MGVCRLSSILAGTPVNAGARDVFVSETQLKCLYSSISLVLKRAQFCAKTIPYFV